MVGKKEIQAISYTNPAGKITVYSDCSDVYVTPQHNIVQLCYEPTCVTGPPYSPCTRQDLDPCDYSNMEDYGKAVVCELNRVIMDCKLINYPEYPCTVTERCIKNLDTPPGLLNCADPWKYCSLATSCEPYYCPGYSTCTNLIHHIYLSVADQDILIAYARTIANLVGVNLCGQNYNATPFGIFFKICYNSNDATTCEQNSPSFCTNMDIRLHVYYKCCGEPFNPPIQNDNDTK
ncbi:MAG: hypothetical protein IT265_02290 [Saprospiraceae bacterium]|nr:hypothetical protein [Saprospiraceae bacterium]